MSSSISSVIPNQSSTMSLSYCPEIDDTTIDESMLEYDAKDGTSPVPQIDQFDHYNNNKAITNDTEYDNKNNCCDSTYHYREERQRNYAIGKEEEFLARINYVPSMRRVKRRESRRGRKKRDRKKKRRRNFEYIQEQMQEYQEHEEAQVIDEVNNYADDQSSYYSSDGESISLYNRNMYEGIAPAAELGIEEGEMYERLLAILGGDEISPEDYDLLLQLDNNNTRKTLDENEIANFPIIIIGGDNDSSSLLCSSSSSSKKCEICLESWSDLPNGTEIRCLPCDHMFCKVCVDDWLTQRSHKCPNLSCYWCLEKE